MARIRKFHRLKKLPLRGGLETAWTRASRGPKLSIKGRFYPSKGVFVRLLLTHAYDTTMAVWSTQKVEVASSSKPSKKSVEICSKIQ